MKNNQMSINSLQVEKRYYLSFYYLTRTLY